MFFKQGIKRLVPYIVGAIVTKLSLKADLGIWGNNVRYAIHFEIKQIHMRDTFLQIH